MRKPRGRNTDQHSAESSLGGRLQWLIDQVHGGNVSKAAQAISTASGVKISQPTLARLIAGINTRPRPETVRAICFYYGATADWLLYGIGSPPSAQQSAEERTWFAFVKRLGLSDRATRCLHRLTIVEVPFFPEAREAAQALGPTASAQVASAAAHFMLARQTAWLTYLSALVDIVGPDAVGRFLDPVPLWLVQQFLVGENDPYAGTLRALAGAPILSDATQRAVESHLPQKVARKQAHSRKKT